MKHGNTYEDVEPILPVSPRFSRRSSLLPGSRIRLLVSEVAKLKKKGLDIYELHIGQPGLPPCKELLEELKDIMLKDSFNFSRYTPSVGLEDVRQAIAEDYSRDSGGSFGIENVILSTGSSEAILALLMLFIDEGDEVIMFDPEYLLYKPLLEYFGAKVVEVPVSVERGYLPDVEDLKRAVSRRTKLIIFVNPDNPTGRVADDELVKTVIDLAQDYDFYIIYDEAYRELYYEGSHIYAACRDLEHVIALNTMSKGAALPGWRLGYVVAHDSIIKELSRVIQYVNLNPPTPSQYAAKLFVTKYKSKYLREVIPIYRERRDAMYEAVRKYLPEARTVKPKAGLFMFVDLSRYLSKRGIDDERFSRELLETMHVAVVPGSSFGDAGRMHVRMCFAKETPERIDEAIRRIATFFE